MISTKTAINTLFVTVFNKINQFENLWLQKENVNLTINEVHVIESIGNFSPVKLGDLASNLYITPSTLTPVVNRLLKKNYVCRYKDFNDKRISYLSLTKNGISIFNSHAKFHDEMIKSTIKTLNREQLNSLGTALSNLTTFFTEIIEEDSHVHK